MISLYNNNTYKPSFLSSPRIKIKMENKEWTICNNPACKKPKHKDRLCSCGCKENNDIVQENHFVKKYKRKTK